MNSLWLLPMIGLALAWLLLRVQSNRVNLIRLTNLSESEHNSQSQPDNVPPRKTEDNHSGVGLRGLAVLILVVAALFLALYLGVPLDIVIVLSVVCLVIWGIVLKSGRGNRSGRAERAINFFLPLAVERLVMAVTAGHDVYSALQILCNDEARSLDDPVLPYFKRVLELNNAGIPLEQAFGEVIAGHHNTGLRHTFLHLAIAQREGGSLVQPLRELSDAVSLFYQESIEEEIATLPIKGTVPLVITFAGLMICMLTVPVVQVLKTTRGSFNDGAESRDKLGGDLSQGKYLSVR